MNFQVVGPLFQLCPDTYTNWHWNELRKRLNGSWIYSNASSRGEPRYFKAVASRTLTSFMKEEDKPCFLPRSSGRHEESVLPEVDSANNLNLDAGKQRLSYIPKRLLVQKRWCIQIENTQQGWRKTYLYTSWTYSTYTPKHGFALDPSAVPQFLAFAAIKVVLLAKVNEKGNFPGLVQIFLSYFQIFGQDLL